jgi:DNA polymerase III epsilon subunit-like protein
MSKLAFVDFEANGFPDEDGTFRACLTYMQRTKIKFEDVFKKLDKSFKLTDWKAENDDISDANVIESTFIKIWSVYKENKNWKTQLLQTALKSHGMSKNWWILNVTKTVKETQSTDHYLCYKDDIEIIDSMDQQYTIKDKDNTETAVALELVKFEETNQDHVDLVLKTVFATTILSCAILHVQERNDHIQIITHDEFKGSQSQMSSCYYQVYKQDEHYEHSISAQRIHNLGYDYLQEKGVPLEDIVGFFLMLGKSTKFVAHNAPIDQRYLTNNVERILRYYQYKSIIYPKDKVLVSAISQLQKLLTRVKEKWICTLSAARKAYQKAIPYYVDAAEEAKNELKTIRYQTCTNTSRRRACRKDTTHRWTCMPAQQSTMTRAIQNQRTLSH